MLIPLGPIQLDFVALALIALLTAILAKGTKESMVFNIGEGCTGVQERAHMRDMGGMNAWRLLLICSPHPMHALAPSAAFHNMAHTFHTSAACSLQGCPPST